MATGTVTTDNKIPAFDVFKAQFATYFDNVDAEAPWLNALYNSSQKYYNMGMDENSIPDILLTDENAPQAYKDRFSGIFKLKQRKAQGYNVAHVPSVAEYSAMAKQMKDEFKKYGLNDLANDANVSNIIGNDVDVEEMTNRMSDAFFAIDNADQYLKKELASNFPSVGRAELAKALLTGEQGAKELKKKIDIAGVKAAASEFGLENQLQAQELYNMGVTRAEARQGYEKTAQELTGLTEAQKRFGGGGNIQAGLESANVLGKTSQDVNRLRSQARAEFSGQTGATSGSLRRKRQL